MLVLESTKLFSSKREKVKSKKKKLNRCYRDSFPPRFRKEYTYQSGKRQAPSRETNAGEIVQVHEKIILELSIMTQSQTDLPGFALATFYFCGEEISKKFYLSHTAQNPPNQQTIEPIKALHGKVTRPSNTYSKFFTVLRRKIMNSEGKKHEESIKKEGEVLSEKGKR